MIFQKQMEYLAQLYEERLQSLKQMFLKLLNNLEKSTLFSTTALAQYRIEYVGSMVTEAFKSNEEALIQRLMKEANALRKRLQEAQSRISLLEQKENSQYWNHADIQESWTHEKQKTISRRKVPSQETSATKLSTFSDWTDEDNSEAGRRNESVEESLISCKFKYLKLKF